MTLEEALGLLSRVCQQHQGTLQDHQTIQAAFKVVNDACQPEDE